MAFSISSGVTVGSKGLESVKRRRAAGRKRNCHGDDCQKREKAFDIHWNVSFDKYKN
jgi:hypothetical protein